MIDKEKFKEDISSKQEGELLIPFEDLDLDLEPFDKNVEQSPERLKAITEKQNELVKWCGEVSNLNWSVGFVDVEERSVMVVKWWFAVPAENPTEEPVE